MEISSFPTLSPPDAISQVCSSPYFTELLHSSSSSSPFKKRHILNNNNVIVNQPTDHVIHHHVNTNFDDSNITNLKDILASILMFNDHPTSDHPQILNFVSMLNSNHHHQGKNQQVDADDAVEAEVAELESLKDASSEQQQRPLTKKRSRNTVEPPSSMEVAQHPKRLWVKARSKDWWEKRSHPDFPSEEFKKYFRMSKATFNMICEELEPVITKKDTLLRAAIPVNQRIGVCIWRLATGEPLRLVSMRFGLGISTCHKLVLEVCTAIKTTLMAKFLQWPDDARMSAIKEEFEHLSGIPNVGGSIYTTHIPIIAPKVNVGAYFNKHHTERNHKTSYSITVQGVVDPTGVFTDVCIGWPGSMPDDKVLEQSALFQRANRGLLHNVWMVGNSGYPLTDWVLVPYIHQNLTWTQHTFNERIGEIQKVGAMAFGRLKKRWGCLRKRTEVKLQELPALLGACCVLHNICEMRKEGIEPEVDSSFHLYDDKMMADNPIRSTVAVQARDHIAHNLLHHGHVGTSFL